MCMSHDSQMQRRKASILHACDTRNDKTLDNQIAKKTWNKMACITMWEIINMKIIIPKRDLMQLMLQPLLHPFGGGIDYDIKFEIV